MSRWSFWLKNVAGWRDTRTIEVEGGVGEQGRREEEAAQLEMIQAMTPEERRSYVDLMTRLAHRVKAKQAPVETTAARRSANSTYP